MERPSKPKTVAVWDPLVRLGHWGLVVAFATAYLSEGDPEWLHTYAGYAIAGIVGLRVIWGFAGPRHARFSDFVTGPGSVLAYLKGLLTGQSERHPGHSPAGGAMTVVLLVALAATAFTGMGNLAAEEGHGPLSGIVAQASEHSAGLDEHNEDDGAELWEETHEIAANLTLILIFLHLGGVALASYAHRENLARAMVTGRKRA
ncbi:MAG: cytochrome b/b6 domain-containing protein [Roseovarius sp.]|jgi:cytochrome b|uniref:cytochrome b/b6 domain-containing protein n=1 Tax=Roseovarius sp. TaxID=1486281 RepID=UPI0032EFE67F